MLLVLTDAGDNAIIRTMFASVCILVAAVAAMMPAARQDASWHRRLEEKSAAVKAGGSEVVFLGDENIHFYEAGWGGETVWRRYWAGEPYKALNLGFSGDCIENVLWRITDGGELDGYSAKAIILSIGINNIVSRGACVGDVIDGTRCILKEIAARQPNARTILCALLPRGGVPGRPYQDKLDAVNREICKFADGRGVIWCDFSDIFVNVPSLAEGYEMWTAALMPMVNEALRGGGLPIAPRYPAKQREKDESLSLPEAVRPITRIMEPNRNRGTDWWGRRFAEHRDFIAGHKSIDLVMAGDSITHFWESYGGAAYASLTNRFTVLNCGYGGDQTQNVIWRFMHGELDGYRAKTVMLTIGTNNNGIRGYNPTNTAAGVKACLDLVAKKQPQAKVLLCAIPPRAVGTADGDTAKDGADARNRETNALIRKFADGKRVVWVDFREKFFVDGRIPKSLMGDYIHPTEKGYAIWLEEILRKGVMKWCAKQSSAELTE